MEGWLTDWEYLQLVWKTWVLFPAHTRLYSIICNSRLEDLMLSAHPHGYQAHTRGTYSTHTQKVKINNSLEKYFFA